MLVHDTHARPASLTRRGAGSGDAGAAAAALVERCGFVRVPAGAVLMGDARGDGYPQERPVHEVHVRAFWAGRHSVTVQEYFAFIEDAGDAFDDRWCDFINPCFIVKHGDRYRMRPGTGRYPMIQVSFVGAVAYCNWLSAQGSRQPVYDLATLEADLAHDGVRLLTEAEWEYACGGPRQQVYGRSDRFDAESVCWREYAGRFAHLAAGPRRMGGFGVDERGPLPVGTLPPNDYGLYEMVGNVNEWCHDRYAPYAPGTAHDPTGASAGSFRVIRGGSFIDGRDKLRKTYRHGLHYQSKCMVDGFRIAMNG